MQELRATVAVARGEGRGLGNVDTVANQDTTVV